MRLHSFLLLLALFISQLGLPAWSMTAVPAVQVASLEDGARNAEPSSLKECSGIVDAAVCEAAQYCDACQLCQACHPAGLPEGSWARGIPYTAHRPLPHLAVTYLSAERAPSFKPPIL